MAEEQRYQRMNRRVFLRRAGGVAIALPSMAAILAACSKPEPEGPGGGGATATGIPIARQDAPVTLPMNGEPVATDAPMEEGTLQIYNWSDYMWKRVLADWEAEADRAQEWTTVNNMSEAQQKLSAGQVTADVFFPTVDILSKLVVAGLLQPLNHELLPNIEGMWPQFSGEDTPFYDQGWRYTVPYVIYNTGIGFRRDHVDEAEVAEKGWDILWDPKYRGKVGIYDDYRESLGAAMLRRGVTDVNTGDAAVIEQAKEDLLELVRENGARISINGTYVGIPEDRFWLHVAWSGDMIGAQYYMPKDTPVSVLGFHLPEAHAVGNDLITIPAVAEHPVMAHHFINFFISEKHATRNFSWNGYQPPLTAMDPGSLVDQGYVPPSVEEAVVRPDHFDTGQFYLALEPEVDDLWQNAWDEVKAG